MKNLILLFLILTSSIPCNADCAMGATSFFPLNRTNISTNSIFIIQGYGTTTATVKNFPTRKVFLESESGELIELKLKEIFTGKGQNQAIFFPSSKLKYNTKYHLKYSDETPIETKELSVWNSATKNQEKITWTTASEEIENSINIDFTFRFVKSESKMYGCGNSSNAIFEINKVNNSTVIFKTELLDLRTNEISTFYVFPDKNILKVGYEMCSGNFDLKDSSNYKVRFTPTNSSGNEAKTSEWKAFKSAKNPYLR
ncbi:hypothetical protein GV828_04175 [Flavobacterium sp. NST-5]|uniref:Uncharacterized protein n=1 Tax=Flavobacterium ichthyis TaxID=2698827 RepID=A0ABW9Z6B6_9FLAO|nr:hypothetical protein [Flavobacterium ichthyis]NBL64398.1 hypothetical protein [Flavobacterium ichthyis]